MSNRQGWVKIHRSILDHWLWNEKPFTKGQAFLDLILLANHEDKNTMHGGKIVMCKRGTVNRSILSLADRWGWDRKKVRNFLNVLIEDEMVTTSSTTHGTTITIVKYDFFQGLGTTDSTTDSTTTPQQLPQPLPINKNDKNDKNDKKNNIVFKPPTIEEVEAYCIERGKGVDPEQWYDHYSSNGWLVGKNKMKDWKASIRTWERNKTKWSTTDNGISEPEQKQPGYKQYLSMY